MNQDTTNLILIRTALVWNALNPIHDTKQQKMEKGVQIFDNGGEKYPRRMPTRGAPAAAEAQKGTLPSRKAPNGRRNLPIATIATRTRKDDSEKGAEECSVATAPTESDISSPEKSEMETSTAGPSPSDKSMDDSAISGSPTSDQAGLVGTGTSPASGKRKRSEDDYVAEDLGDKLQDAASQGDGIQHQMILDMAKVEVAAAARSFKGLDPIVGGLVARWAGMKFRAVKFLNSKLLDPSVEGNLLSQAEGVTGAMFGSSEADKQRPALARFLRHKFNQMRDYFLMKVKTTIMKMRKLK